MTHSPVSWGRRRGVVERVNTAAGSWGIPQHDSQRGVVGVEGAAWNRRGGRIVGESRHPPRSTTPQVEWSFPGRDDF